MHEIEKQLNEQRMEMIFNAWRQLGLQCAEHGAILQNGLEHVCKDDINEWGARLKIFKKKMGDLAAYTHEIMKKYLEEKDGKEGQPVRQAGEDSQEG